MVRLSLTWPLEGFLLFPLIFLFPPSHIMPDVDTLILIAMSYMSSSMSCTRPVERDRHSVTVAAGPLFLEQIVGWTGSSGDVLAWRRAYPGGFALFAQPSPDLARGFKQLLRTAYAEMHVKIIKRDHQSMSAGIIDACMNLCKRGEPQL
jgi:hypothetical protein